MHRSSQNKRSSARRFNSRAGKTHKRNTRLPFRGGIRM